MDGADPYAPVARPRGRAGLVWLLLACLLGAALMVAGLHRFPKIAWRILPAPPVTVAALPAAPEPVVVQMPVAAAPPDAALSGRVDELTDRVEQVDQRATQASGDADRAEGMLVAFAARRALDRGQPLGFLEGMLRQRFGGREPQAVAMVIAAAQRPVTLPMLQDRLAQLSASLQTAAASESWWRGFRRELGQVFVVRRGDAPSPLPADRLARAAHALDNGQADAALIEVARLPNAGAAADWIAAARRYVLARNALDRIETAALLAPAPPPVAVSAPSGD